MDELTSPTRTPAVLREIPRYRPPTAPVMEPIVGRVRIPPLNLVLFGLTVLTTTMAGAYLAGVNLWEAGGLGELLVALAKGLSFSVPLMAILLSHEMGHYLFARRHGVDVTLPYFIPAPFPSVFIIGTFGAFIRIKSRPPSRRVMFDVGAAGPWFGFVLSIIAVVYGLEHSQVGPLSSARGGLDLGNSMLFWAIARVTLGVDPDTVSVGLHPVAFAGWLGLFVTTLNLLPVGQLDGGHVTYALFGRRWHQRISWLLIYGCVAIVLVPWVLGRGFWLGWIFWAVLLLFLGISHPASTDAVTPLGPMRTRWAVLTIALWIVTFTPVPISIVPRRPMPPQGGRTYEVILPPPATAAPRDGLLRVRI